MNPNTESPCPPLDDAQLDALVVGTINAGGCEIGDVVRRLYPLPNLERTASTAEICEWRIATAKWNLAVHAIDADRRFSPPDYEGCLSRRGFSTYSPVKK